MSTELEANKEPDLETLSFDNGITAQLTRNESLIRIYNRDGQELFRFGSNICPWGEGPIQFLIDIYRVGFDRGKMLGRDTVKAHLRQLLGSEL